MNDVSHGKTRRAFLQGTAAALAVPLFLTARKGAAATPPVVLPPSPPTTPWSVYLDDAVGQLAPVDALYPAPTEDANTGAGEAGRASHQRFVELTSDRDKSPTLYEMTAKENPNWSFNPAYPLQPIWGFAGHSPSGPPDATTPGPTSSRYSQPISAASLTAPHAHVGFGTPRYRICTICIRLRSDGFPGDYYGPQPDLSGVPPWRLREFLDHFYPNIWPATTSSMACRATTSAIARGLGTRGTMTTPGFHLPNVYRGMAGFYLIFDDRLGNENDYLTRNLRLPSIPMTTH